MEIVEGRRGRGENKTNSQFAIEPPARYAVFMPKGLYAIRNKNYVFPLCLFSMLKT
jgi:hypothetical protein